MKLTEIKGVYKEKNQLFTENLKECKGMRVYGEKIIKYKNREYRSWNPFRSKLAAAILNGMDFDINPNHKILYLGASTGTTVSHLSDIVFNGLIYAVEISPISMKKLLINSKKRKNIIPILSDANHPDFYKSIIDKVDLIYQDISQRNQADIFINNVKNFLKKNGSGIFMVKSRNIDVTIEPDRIYKNICKYLEENNLEIVDIFDLMPFERDHKAVFVKI